MPEPDDLERTHRVPPTDLLRKRCFAILHEAGIEDRTSRQDLAEWVLKRDVDSWTSLSRFEWMRITDALVGWESVRELRRQSGRLKD